jgi:hypothetical protein
MQQGNTRHIVMLATQSNSSSLDLWLLHQSRKKTDLASLREEREGIQAYIVCPTKGITQQRKLALSCAF